MNDYSTLDKYKDFREINQPPKEESDHLIYRLMPGQKIIRPKCQELETGVQGPAYVRLLVMMVRRKIITLLV